MLQAVRSSCWRAVARAGIICFIATSVLPAGWAAPLVVITNPPDGATVTGQVWIEVSFRSDTASPISRLQLYVDGTVQRDYILAAPQHEGRQAFSYDFSFPPGSKHEITAKAFDADGNVGQATIHVEVKSAQSNAPDRIPPVISIYYPTQGERLSGTVEIKADATDNVAVKNVYFYLDGKLKTLKINTSPPYVDRWDTRKIADGEHTLQAVAEDAAGNQGRSENVIVVVENHQMTLASPTATTTQLQTPRTITISPGSTSEAPPLLETTPSVVVTPAAGEVQSQQFGTPASQQSRTAPAAAEPAPKPPSTSLATAEPQVPPTPALTASPAAAPLPAGNRIAMPSRIAQPSPAGRHGPSLALLPPTSPAVPAPGAEPAAPVTTQRSPGTSRPLLIAAAPAGPQLPELLPGRISEPTAPPAAAPAQPATAADRPLMLAALPETPSTVSLPNQLRVTKPATMPLTPVALAAMQDVKVVFDNEVLSLRAAPEVKHGISTAALREIFEHTDGVLYWYPIKKKVHAVNSDTDIWLQIGNPVVTVNNQQQTLELAPYIKRGRTMVPLQFIADTLDVTITYNPATGEIVISSNEL